MPTVSGMSSPPSVTDQRLSTRLSLLKGSYVHQCEGRFPGARFRKRVQRKSVTGVTYASNEPAAKPFFFFFLNIGDHVSKVTVVNVTVALKGF